MHRHIFHDSLIKRLNFCIHFIILRLIFYIFHLFHALTTFAHLIISKFIYVLPKYYLIYLFKLHRCCQNHHHFMLIQEIKIIFQKFFVFY